MSKSNPSSVTAEEAVARMVNMDYIPEGFTLEEMLSAFHEEAEVNYENAKIDRLPATQIDALKIRMEACEARESLALLLLEDLRNIEHDTQWPAIVLSEDSSSKPRYTLESISDWATFKYGIGIPEWWLSEFTDPTTSRGVSADVKWGDIEIRIRKNDKIAYSHKKGKWKEKTFAEIGLLNMKTQQPNHQAGILIGLSIGKKFPPSSTADGKYKTAIHRLGKSLKTLTGIEDDPFIEFNKTDGWKPRFKLSDDRRNADDRAKKEAIHEQYIVERDYDIENDDAGDLLKDK